MVVKTGVTVMVEEAGAVPELTALNGPMFPDPDALVPITGLEEVQLKRVPARFDEKEIAAV